jgi:DNA-binding XRE family transcriptional regulator
MKSIASEALFAGDYADQAYLTASNAADSALFVVDSFPVSDGEGSYSATMIAELNRISLRARAAAEEARKSSLASCEAGRVAKNLKLARKYATPCYYNYQINEELTAEVEAIRRAYSEAYNAYEKGHYALEIANETLESVKIAKEYVKKLEDENDTESLPTG